jgi:hypothetical protein
LSRTGASDPPSLLPRTQGNPSLAACTTPRNGPRRTLPETRRCSHWRSRWRASGVTVSRGRRLEGRTLRRLANLVADTLVHATGRGAAIKGAGIPIITILVRSTPGWRATAQGVAHCAHKAVDRDPRTWRTRWAWTTLGIAVLKHRAGAQRHVAQSHPNSDDQFVHGHSPVAVAVTQTRDWGERRGWCRGRRRPRCGDVGNACAISGDHLTASQPTSKFWADRARSTRRTQCTGATARPCGAGLRWCGDGRR